MTVTGYSCPQTSLVTIPDTFYGWKVTAIGSSAFRNCTTVTTVRIPASVTVIEDSAFSGCSRLAGIYFLGDAPSLGSAVFAGAGPTVYYKSGTAGWGATFGGLTAIATP
jgi:hypothetical protein